MHVDALFWGQKADSYMRAKKGVIMLENELEPEFVSLLADLRRPDPAALPGNQQERSRTVPAKLVTGAYLNRLKLPMVQFACHLKFVFQTVYM
jgi:hypothetical protein